eukprot:SAG25_NODE_1179_length_3680_cov_3.132086_4_plen_371_part_00
MPKGGKKQAAARGGQKAKGGQKAQAVRKTQTASKRRVQKKAADKERMAALTRQCVVYCLKHGLQGRGGIKDERTARKFETVSKGSLSRHLTAARSAIKAEEKEKIITPEAAGICDLPVALWHQERGPTGRTSVNSIDGSLSAVDAASRKRERNQSDMNCAVQKNEKELALLGMWLDCRVSGCTCGGKDWYGKPCTAYKKCDICGKISTRQCAKGDCKKKRDALAARRGRAPAPAPTTAVTAPPASSCSPHGIAIICCPSPPCPRPSPTPCSCRRRRARLGRRRAAGAGRSARPRAALSAVWGAGLIFQPMRSCAPRPCQALTNSWRRGVWVVPAVSHHRETHSGTQLTAWNPVPVHEEQSWNSDAENCIS